MQVLLQVLVTLTSTQVGRFFFLRKRVYRILKKIKKIHKKET